MFEMFMALRRTMYGHIVKQPPVRANAKSSLHLVRSRVQAAF